MDHPPADRPRAAAGTPYAGPERRLRKPLFGLRLRDFDVAQCADHLLGDRRTAAQGLGLFVTPNIQHVATMRTDADFAAAMRGAQLIVCDGFPVYRYAQLRGQAMPGRITGRDVIDRMFAQPERLAGHRLFFVVDSDETAGEIMRWTRSAIPAAAIDIVVPPFGFSNDAAYSVDLATRIADFGTSLLFMGVGAPQSEVFVHRLRAVLPPCWALCVGQSFKIALGMTTPPPSLLVALNLEWFWRILLEPRRMLRRYGASSLGFLAAVRDDLRGSRPDDPPQ